MGNNTDKGAAHILCNEETPLLTSKLFLADRCRSDGQQHRQGCCTHFVQWKENPLLTSKLFLAGRCRSDWQQQHRQGCCTFCAMKITLHSPQSYFWLVGVEVIGSNNTDKILVQVGGDRKRRTSRTTLRNPTPLVTRHCFLVYCARTWKISFPPYLQMSETQIANELLHGNLCGSAFSVWTLHYLAVHWTHSRLEQTSKNYQKEQDANLPSAHDVESHCWNQACYYKTWWKHGTRKIARALDRTL